MAEENVPAGQASDGRGLVAFVDTIADTLAPTAAVLNGGDRLTYSLVPDGFRHETTENVIPDGRYTLKQLLELPGTISDTLELQYVAGTPAQTTLAEGTTGFIIHRLGVDNSVDFAAGQKVDIIPVRMGVQRKVAPTANTTLQRVQKAFVTGPVRRDVAVV
jgi:hypothetical protein